MAVVNLLINGHAYTIACDEGEQARLRELGEYVDKRVQEVMSQIGPSMGDTRLILMAALLIADELSEAMGKIEERERELAELAEAHSSAEASLRDTEDALAEALESAAAQIDSIATRLAPPN